MVEKMKDLVCLGAIVGVHGIRGEVKVKSFTAHDLSVAAYGKLQNEEGSKFFDLKVSGHCKELLRCKIKGVDDRNAAEAMVGTKLYVLRSCLPSLDQEEYYQADLIGLDVMFENEPVAKVSGVYNFGAGDILELQFLEEKKTEMIPFTKEYVPEIKISEGYLVVQNVSMLFANEEQAENEG